MSQRSWDGGAACKRGVCGGHSHRQSALHKLCLHLSYYEDDSGCCEHRWKRVHDPSGSQDRKWNVERWLSLLQDDDKTVMGRRLLVRKKTISHIRSLWDQMAYLDERGKPPEDLQVTESRC